MGTITERKRKNGSVAFMAQIVIKRDGKVAHRENRTFDRRPTANSWMKRREKELTAPGGLQEARIKKAATLDDAIDQYIQDSEKKIGRTKTQVLRTIRSYEICRMECANIQSTDLVAFAKQLKETQNLKPQTVSNYLSHLAAVFRIAKPAWGMPLDGSAISDAQIVLKRLGQTGKGKGRERRPTLDELDRILSHFSERAIKYPDAMPMHTICLFALFSTRRQEEITNLALADLDAEGKRILVRDMKHPGQKIGNDVWCDLPDPVLMILKSASPEGGFFFPYNHRTISANFTRACQFLQIKDLHFHDLRHEGVSRLFELGYSIPHAAAVSGHRSWSSLQRYAHIRQTGDKYAGWKWLESVDTE